MKLVAWDFDGVLNRGFQGGFDAWQSSFEADLGVPAKGFTDYVYTERNFVSVLTGQQDLMALMEGYVAAYAVPHSARAVLDYWLTKDCVLDAQVVGWAAACPLPGVIATNNESHRAAHIWQALGAHRFQHIFASGPMGVKKPDPGFYAQIEAWSGLSGAEILLVDDAEKNIAAAAERGWQVFHFTDATREGLPKVLGISA